MQTTISYKGDDTKRRAINDLIGWFGFGRSKLIFRELRKARQYADQHPDWNLNEFLDGVCFAIEMGGVQGEPVRQLFAHYFGKDRLASWMAS